MTHCEAHGSEPASDADHAWAYHVAGSNPVLYCMHQCNEDRQAYHMVLDNVYLCEGISVTIPDIIFPEIEALHELQEALKCLT